MSWLTDGLRVLGWPLASAAYDGRSGGLTGETVGVPHAAPDTSPAASPGADGVAESTLAAKAQRLAELQEELHQLERLPTLTSGTLDGSADLMASALPPDWHERMLEIECEIEQLREEIETEEVEPARPEGAAEEVGERILQQLGSSDAAEESERELTHG